MLNKEKFLEEIAASYTFKGNSIILGASVLEGVPNEHSLVKAPLQTFNRHGLIAGATGTGKTKTLQMITEKLSLNGVPTLVMDIKGDLSGIAAAGTCGRRIAGSAALRFRTGWSAARREAGRSHPSADGGVGRQGHRGRISARLIRRKRANFLPIRNP